MQTPHRRRTSTMLYVAAFVFVLVLASMSLLSREAIAQFDPLGGTAPPGTLPPPLRAQVTFIHAAPVFSDTQMTAIDVCNEDGQVVNNLQGVVYGQSETFTTDSGVLDWKVAVAGSGCSTLVKDIPPFKIGNGGHAIVVAIGDVINQPLDTLVIIPNQGGGYLHMPYLGKSVAVP